MGLIRYEPWSLMARLQRDIDRALGDRAANDTSAVMANWIPAADIEEYTDRFEISVDLPGVSAENVDVTLEDGVLTLSGERTFARPDETIAQHRRERGHGRFYRRFVLPDSVDADLVKATEHNGVLEVTIPKRAAAQPRRIQVAA